MKTQQFKTGIAILLLGTLLTSCAKTYEAIGHVSMLSAGTYVNPGIKYQQLTSNSGGSKKEVKHSKAESVRVAIKNVIGSVAGGCFMTNVTVYAVNDGYFAVSGNVWGTCKDSVPAVRTIVINKYPANYQSSANTTYAAAAMGTK